MLPDGFIKRIHQQEYIDPEALQNALNKPPSVSVRINRAKWGYEPADAQPVPWCKDAFYLKERPSFTLDPAFHGGGYYPQEASSLFLEEVYRQITENRDNIKILDLCGAPGGKSTHLSSMIGQSGLLVANEVIRSRAVILAENITKWGHSNTIVTQNDPSAFAAVPGFFDVILVDAPCSGEGMFHDPVAVKEWSAENTVLCSERQKRILMDVWPALKEDGMLIYSTCTFNPEENEKNIRWLLQNRNAVSVRLNISDFEGITEINHEGTHGYGLYPCRIRGEGLFISVLRKAEKAERENRRFKEERRVLSSNEEKHLAEELSDFPEGSLIKINDEIISTP
jgi:16S rRNA C967 or C1407 C5-methylase (RsmB/RsmF family)